MSRRVSASTSTPPRASAPTHPPADVDPPASAHTAAESHATLPDRSLSKPSNLTADDTWVWFQRQARRPYFRWVVWICLAVLASGVGDNEITRRSALVFFGLLVVDVVGWLLWLAATRAWRHACSARQRKRGLV